MTRTKKETLRIYGPPAYRTLLDQIGCIICGASPVQVCHTKSGGVGRKADYKDSVGMCPTHHREQHQRGTKSFEARYGVSLTDRAAQIQQAWRRREEGC